MKPYLHIQNHFGKNVYYLNPQGRELVGSKTEVKWSLQAEHHLMRNDVYIHYGMPGDWKVEKRFSFKPAVGDEKWIVPDARFQKDEFWVFVEIDRTQSMGENEKKINRYKEFSPILFDAQGRKPHLVFYTVTEIRRNQLKKLCDTAGLSCEILTKEDLR